MVSHSNETQKITDMIPISHTMLRKETKQENWVGTSQVIVIRKLSKAVLQRKQKQKKKYEVKLTIKVI